MSSQSSPEIFRFKNDRDGDKSTFVLLDVSDRGISIPTDVNPTDLSYNNLLIFAETVTITSDILFRKRNIGVFCSSLELPNGAVEIDVSAAAAPAVIDVPEGQGIPGKPGENSGFIWVYVENMNSKVAENLTLKANGGEGGIGGSTEGSERAGNGGPGGKAGTISYLWRSQAGDALSTLHTCSAAASSSWTSTTGHAELILYKTKGLLSMEQTDSIRTVLDRYQNYIAAADLCRGVARTLQFTLTNPSTKIYSELSSFIHGLGELLAALEGPNLTDDLLIQNTRAAIATIRKYTSSLENNTKVDDAALLASLHSATVSWSGVSESTLRQSLKKASESIWIEFLHLQSTCTEHCQVIRGTGGRGGHGADFANMNGIRGDIGGPGTLVAKELVYDSSSSDLDVMMAYAFPDQCQMLLNKANALFFQNTQKSVREASILYNRLTGRLSFVPSLVEAQSRGLKPALLESYFYLEFGLEITYSAIGQLESVSSQSKTFMNQIKTGQDMFGHQPTWVPRLSYQFYSETAATFLPTLDKVQKAYDNARQNMDSVGNFSVGRNAAQAGVQDAKDRVFLLTQPNGALASNAAIISEYTPLLKKKIKDVHKDITLMATDIGRSTNLDPLDILNALSSIAMAPSVPLGLIQSYMVAYKALTTVKNDQTDTDIKQSYVVTELGKAGSTLAKVSTSYVTRQDKTIKAEDPGGLKLFASADRIDKLYDEFKSSIPVDDGKELKQNLDRLKHLVKVRNDAVIGYNSAIQLLNQAETDKRYYKKQAEVYSDKQAQQLNPHLPSVVLWLRRTRDNYALEIMRMLNYGNRAIYFWGLSQPSDFKTPGPLQDYETLSQARLSLALNFESAIEAFAGSAPSHWPTPGHQGAIFKLDYGDIFTLKNAQSPDFQIAVTLAPGIKDAAGDVLLAGQANVRLDRVRLWLIGAEVSANESGKSLIRVVITQLGNEVIQGGDGESVQFLHDPVAASFVYDSANVVSLSDCTEDKVWSQQFLPNYYVGEGNPRKDAIAAIGPWATWMFEIRSNENPGLRMENLKAAYIELGGYSSPFLGPPPNT